MRKAACAAALALVGVVGAVAVPAPAQEQDGDGVAVHVLRQPYWHEPGDRLDLRIRIDNLRSRSIAGFLIQVAAHARTTNRTSLHRAFEGDAGIANSLFTIEEFADRPIAPDGSVVVTLDHRLDSLTTFATATEGGVYPLTISVHDADTEAELAAVVTPVPFYPSRPEQPLNLVVAVPLAAVPARAPDGTYPAPDGDVSPLEGAIAPGGWLDGLLDAVERAVSRGVSVGLAPSPRTIEEIADMADGFVRAVDDDRQRVGANSPAARAARGFLQRVRALIRDPAVARMLTPYSLPDLPTLTARFDPQAIATQLAVGEDVLEGDLDLPFERDILHAPDGRVNEPSLEQARLADAGAVTLFASDTVAFDVDPETAGCPNGSPSFACPIRVATVEGATSGFVLDDQLQRRLAGLVRLGDDVVERQQILAETSMIHAELPGTERVVALLLPSDWEPPPSVSTGLFTALRRAPWLRTVTPDDGLAVGVEPEDHELVESLRTPGAPSAAYFAEVDAAADAVETFRSIEPPDDLLTRLRRNVLTAQGRAWWRTDLIDDGLEFARFTRDFVDDELDKVGVSVPQEVTLTAEQGEIRVQIFNEADYDMRLRLSLDARNLSFEPPDQTLVVPSGGRVVPVTVTSRSSGIFPLRVRLETPDGRSLGDAEPISIRSTTFNDIALAITIGAFAFLVLFYALRAARSARRSRLQKTRAGDA